MGGQRIRTKAGYCVLQNPVVRDVNKTADGQ